MRDHVTQHRERGPAHQRHIGARLRVEETRQQHEAADLFRVPQGQFQRHDAAQGMSGHDGGAHAQPPHCFRNQLGLAGDRPDTTARARSVTEPGSVESNYLMIDGQAREHAARLPILSRCAIAVQQHNRRSLATLEVVHPHPIHVDEPAAWRVLALAAGGQRVIE